MYEDCMKIKSVNMMIWNYCAGENKLDQYESILEDYEFGCEQDEQTE